MAVVGTAAGNIQLTTANDGAAAVVVVAVAGRKDVAIKITGNC